MITISVWQAAFKVTGNKLYRAKAQSLANSLTIAQQFWGSGEYPTWVRKSARRKLAEQHSPYIQADARLR